MDNSSGSIALFALSVLSSAVGAADVLVPAAMAIGITVLALVAQARLLRNERIVFSR